MYPEEFETPSDFMLELDMENDDYWLQSDTNDYVGELCREYGIYKNGSNRDE